MRRLLIFVLFGFCFAFLPAQKMGFNESPVAVEKEKNIYEKVSFRLGENGTAADARTYLMQYKPEITALACDLVLAHERKSPGGFHYGFRQTYGGFPIYNASIKANAWPNKRIVNVLNNLKHFTGIPAPFEKDVSMAEAHVEATYHRGQPDFAFTIEKWYFIQDEELMPVFRVEYNSNSMLWEVLLNADNFEELKRRDMAIYHQHESAAGDTTGSGLVFNPDPLSTSGASYGGNYADNNDADTQELNDERKFVVLQGIDWDGTKFLLQGPYVSLQDAENPTVPIVTSLDGNFHFTRNQQGFEDVMCYYHIDTYQRYVQSFGITDLQNGPLIVDPHGLNSLDNSHFVPQGGNSRLAFGEGCVDDAEDADVIIHEYGHALSYSGSPSTNSGYERNGLDEGYGDYFAASYSKNLTYNYWKNTFTWDGHNMPDCWPGRSASLPTLYPLSPSDFYVYGEIWASTLMEVHDEIGRLKCDEVVLESLHDLEASMTLTDAANVILDADSALNGGAYENNFRQAFCRRGIFDGAMADQSCVLGAADPFSGPIEWNIFPNPASKQFTINFGNMHRYKNLSYEVLNTLGQVLVRGDVSSPFTDVFTEQLPGGLYLVQVRSGEKLFGLRRVEIVH